MGLLTIGAFARAVRMTPKALRLYDELGLLPPAAVDPSPDTGSTTRTSGNGRC